MLLHDAYKAYGKHFPECLKGWRQSLNVFISDHMLGRDVLGVDKRG